LRVAGRDSLQEPYIGWTEGPDLRSGFQRILDQPTALA
jgi:hypothetical protein